MGVDAIKSQIVNRLQAGRTIRFGDTLDETWFEQLTGERRVVRYSRGKPVRAFERIAGRRVEALDCLTYGFAARELMRVDPERRRAELARRTNEERSVVARSKWLVSSKPD